MMFPKRERFLLWLARREFMRRLHLRLWRDDPFKLRSVSVHALGDHVFNVDEGDAA